MSRRHTAAWVGFLGLALVACGGCAYLKDRGNDALDIFDVGVTFSAKPHIGLYAGFQSILAVGYADLDGKMLGIGESQVGWLDMRYRAAGALLDGYQQYAYGGNYEKENPNSPVRRGVGLGLLHDELPDSLVQALNCPKFLHILFLGVNLNCKLGELIDFLLGWTTLDIAGDDGRPRSKPAPPPAPRP